MTRIKDKLEDQLAKIAGLTPDNDDDWTEMHTKLSRKAIMLVVTAFNKGNLSNLLNELSIIEQELKSYNPSLDQTERSGELNKKS